MSDSGVRECFVPHRGFVFGGADYSAIELATLAQCCVTLIGHSALADIINSGVDLHSHLAAQLAGKSYEETLAAVKAGERWAEDLRYAAKAAAFGFPGGLGPAKFVFTKRKEGLSICQSMRTAPEGTCGQKKIREWRGNPCTPVCENCVLSAKELRDHWFAAYPEMRVYFELVSRETESGSGEIEQLFSKRVRGGCGFCDGANTRFQGLAADMAKDALWAVTKECYTDRNSPLWNSRPVIFEHDAIISEIPENKGHEALTRQIELMEAAGRRWCPDVRVKAEGALSRRWYKGAKAVFVNGRMVASKPEKNEDGKTKWVPDA